EEVKKALATKVRQPELTIQDAMRFAAGELGSDESASRIAVEAVAKRYKLEPDEVVELWKKRPMRGPRKAFFRDGTFIVTEGLEDAMSRAPRPRTPKGKKPQKQPKPTPPMTQDNWWKFKRESKKWSELRDFLFAHWVEKSGAVEVLPPKFDTCPTCAGKGYVIQSLSTQTGTVVYPNRCQTCYMATKFRIVRFR
ncbi:MAG: hypothetical protein AAGD14_08785, partial [Planctomycetota bacterium]